MAILGDVKALGRITTDENDDILQHYIDVLSAEALAYTLRSETTIAIDNLVITYTLKLYNSKAISRVGNLKRIKRLDVEEEYSAGDAYTIDEAVISSFRKALAPYRIIIGVII